MVRYSASIVAATQRSAVGPSRPIWWTRAFRTTGGLGVSLELGERLAQPRDGGHPAGEVAVDNVAVDGPPQESGAGAWILDAAEGFHNMDPAPAGDPVRRPEQ
ncbi:hypothetical protein AOB60_04240 [Streptomyces noursei]|uniref:Uncharacterized protein n=1 Tax=Streptomyces noursei TaxID=1971 RepID=A0A2N8PGM7_STRNR|nr:hypothetical protein AOB60_04240 [Streptomyces noursei]